MSLKDWANKASSATSGAQDKMPIKSPTASVTSPGAVLMYQEQVRSAESRAELAETELAILKEQTKGSFEIELSKLVERPGRRRKLSPQDFSELRENLKNNELIHPISVVASSNGLYEIVSGHNRVDIYRDLGKQAIKAVEIKVSEVEADSLAFFANLMQTPLGDYEKYLGFVRMKERSSATQKELSLSSGVSETTLSALMAFGRLPADALAILSQHPAALGMNAAVELAKLYESRTTSADQLVECLVELADGKITQAEVIAKCKRANLTVNRARPTVSKIKAGRFDYCKVSIIGNSLRIDFKDEVLRAEAESKIAELLKEIAASSTNT